MDRLAVICVDEVGRGCCAGPVLACAYLLPVRRWSHPKLNDSKKMTEAARHDVFAELAARRECGMERFEIGTASVEEIDTFNILEATYLAMHRAIKAVMLGAGVEGAHVMVDGNRFKAPESCTYECVVGGDSKVEGIAIASVVAKVARDRLMCSGLYHGAFPQYGWDENKGYVTKQHLDAIREHGFTKHHRMSFDLKL